MKLTQRVFLIVTCLLIVVTVVAAGDYIGPNRHVRDTYNDTITLEYVSGPNPYGIQYCTLHQGWGGGDCNTWPSWEEQNYWCGNGILHTGGWCSAHPTECWRGKFYSQYCATIDLPEATVSGGFACGTAGDNGWCRGGATVSLTASEPLPGEKIRYLEGNQGSGNTTLCDPPDSSNMICLWTAAEGDRNLSFWAHSTFGDTSTMGSLNCKVDTIAPTAVLDISGSTPNANGWYPAGASIRLEAVGTDNTSGVAGSYVQVDNGALQTSPIWFYQEGIFTVRSIVRDNAGNQAASADNQIKIDQTPPTYELLPERLPDYNGWYLSPVTVDVAGHDNLSGYAYTEYILYDGQGNTFTGIMPVTMEGEGWLDLNLRAYDNAGNNRSGSHSIQVDLTAPTASPLVSGTWGLNDWYVGSVILDVDASDTVSGVCSRFVNLNGTGWQGAPLTFADQGAHSFEVQSRDCAGRLSPITPAVDFKIDTVAPTLNVSNPAPDGQNGWHITPVDVSVSGSDSTSGLMLAQVRMDNTPWWDDGITIMAEGMARLDFRAQDYAGNLRTARSLVFVDLSDPVLDVATIGTPGLAGWYISPVVLNAVASDAVSGLQDLQMRQDGQTWVNQNTLNLPDDGTYLVEFLATDRAGRETLAVQEVRIDQTSPTLAPVVIGTMGLNDWYTSAVMLQANAADTTSGIAVVQPAPAFSILEDGLHTVNWLVWDVAGNVATSSLSIKIDQTPPVIAFDPVPDILTGEVTISGLAADSTSGLAKVEVSTTDGLIWEEVSVQPDGSWSFPWNTLLFPGGQALVKARAYDLAGNMTTAELNVTIANRPPDIELTERWYIWEGGELVIEVGDVPYERVTVKICDRQERWPCVVLSYGSGNVPHMVVWDRHFGDIIAPIGEYPVEATITDILGRSSTASGLIVIPQPWTATPNPTITPTEAATPLPTQTGTLQSTATFQPTAIVETLIATLVVITPESTQTILQVIQEKLNIGPFLVLIGFCIVLGASVSRDRRPREWRRLAEQIDQIIQLEKGEQKKK